MQVAAAAPPAAPRLDACARHIKEAMAWACLATMAIAEKELNTAEVAFAAVDMVSYTWRVMCDV